MGKEPRRHVLHVRVTAEEKKEVERKGRSGKKSVDSLLREAAVNQGLFDPKRRDKS